MIHVSERKGVAGAPVMMMGYTFHSDADNFALFAVMSHVVIICCTQILNALQNLIL